MPPIRDSEMEAVVAAPSSPSSNGPLRTSQAWYSGVPGYAWAALAIAALGWMFDTMDQHLFNLVRQESVTQLLSPHVSSAALDSAAKGLAAQLTAIFLLGWAVGGAFFGIVGDRIGRTRTMMLTICIYALFTGLNGLARTPFEYGLCRFLTAIGVGGEFAAGAALVAEVWPERSRPYALGVLQATSGLGNIVASFITLALSSVSWRWAYAVGAAPALLVLWIRSKVPEPKRWQMARAATAGDTNNRPLGSIRSLLQDRQLRRNTAAGILLTLAGVGGVWGVAFFLPDLVGSALKPIVAASPAMRALELHHRAAAVAHAVQAYRSKVSLIQQIGAMLGMLAYPVLSQRTGRRPALLAGFLLAFLSVEITFRCLNSVASAYILAFPLGFFCLMPFSGYAVYFPELYPTRLRATGIGLCYNCARFLAAAAPALQGRLAQHFADPADAT
ncbi:MAG TPA: MFS transporter, partial [Chthonomonadales bacterium]|nr:MFS transporter [Chthonomonadales bacterium]